VAGPLAGGFVGDHVAVRAVLLGTSLLLLLLSAVSSRQVSASCHSIAYKEKPMPELSPIDPESAALLVMDYQVDILTRFMTTAQSADAIACVPHLIATARHVGMMVIHVVVAFRSGHPEVSPRNPLFSALKANGMLVAGSEGAAIHPAAAAREGEPIVVKHRISPFVGADLETLLRANGIGTLVLAGVHTSGVVLSTVRHAGDLDYRLVVVRDCCADPDAELHTMLLDAVIARQAAVVTTAEFADSLTRRSS
jgi:nicotinamidase-related amidase